MNVLVLGGTGPTGPYIVNGLLDRGHKVTIVHSGFHEVEFAGPVEDVHGDVYFKDTLQEALGNRTFDTVIFMYGRLKDTAEFMVGRTGRFIAAGAGGSVPGPRDPSWGLMGRPFLVGEGSTQLPESDPGGLTYKIQEANERTLQLHREGHYNATIIGYPNMYGPRQMAPEDWCVVKRILDGRKQIIIADSGIKIHQRAYTENAAQAVLLAFDKPNESAGELFNVAEQPLYNMRQRIETICSTLNWDMEFVDMPYLLAEPCHYLWFHGPGHSVKDDSKIRRVLGYKELIPVDEAHVLTVKWLVDNREKYSKEWEDQIDDTFDYKVEDALIDTWKEVYPKLADINYPMKSPAHRYRHPKTPFEPWHRPTSTTSYGRRRINYY